MDKTNYIIILIELVQLFLDVESQVRNYLNYNFIS